MTLELQGSVTLEQFADAVARFHRLIAALSADSEVGDVRWEINALDVGSTTATAQGISQNGASPDRIEQVVRNYLEVGQALEKGGVVPYPAPVEKEARALGGMLRSGIDAVRFETAESEAIVREPTTAPVVPAAPQARGAYGAVSGRVQTLTSRNQLRFTLYDRLYDRAVSCYLAEDRETLMREMWDKLATVEGWVTRDPASGRPLAVRRNYERHAAYGGRCAGLHECAECPSARGRRSFARGSDPTNSRWRVRPPHLLGRMRLSVVHRRPMAIRITCQDGRVLRPDWLGSSGPGTTGHLTGVGVAQAERRNAPRDRAAHGGVRDAHLRRATAQVGRARRLPDSGADRRPDAALGQGVTRRRIEVAVDLPAYRSRTMTGLARFSSI